MPAKIEIRTMRVGTRGSKLALWQTALVEEALRRLGINIQVVILKSQGDIHADVPLEDFGVPGVFTDQFDRSLLDGEIDIAVHSLKDYPAALPRGICIGTYLKRGAIMDTLVLRTPIDKLEPDGKYHIATSSSRRRTQWLNRYPQSVVSPIRGNVPTRLAKLYESEWDGAIFARAGLDRLGIRPPHAVDLGWMVPAPAQGVIAVTCREGDSSIRKILAGISDGQTAMLAEIERGIMNRLGGGCEAPIGVLAQVSSGSISVTACVLDKNGQEMVKDAWTFALDQQAVIVDTAVGDLLEAGAAQFLQNSKPTSI